jgi:hypothetical protein
LHDGDDDRVAALVDLEYHPVVADAESVAIATLQALDVSRALGPMRQLLHFGEDALPFALVCNLAQLPYCFGRPLDGIHMASISKL